MHKLFSIATTTALAVLLAACGPKTPPQPIPGPGGNDGPEACDPRVAPCPNVPNE